MFPSRASFNIVSTVMIMLGAVTTGYGAIAIMEMNSTSTSDHLPSVVSLENKQESMTLQNLPVGTAIGSLSIPRLHEKIPITEGTGSKELDKGFGHYIDSVLPGVSGNSVLTGHSDFAFRNFGNLQIGDKLTVRSDSGVFVYEIQRFRIINADDNTAIVPTKKAELTLSTSFPFNHIGIAPMRFIVQAALVSDNSNS